MSGPASADPLVAAVLAGGERPPRASALGASLALAWRGVLKIKHVPEQLADVIGIPVVFTLLFTYLFGGALAGSTGGYLQFLLPGTLVMAVLLVSFYTAVTLNTDRATGVTDRLRTLPIWRGAPIAGGLLGDVGRYVIAAAIVLALGFAMGFHAGGGVAGVVAATALVIAFAVSLSWVCTCAGLLLRSATAVQTAGLLVLFPATFMSNVFVAPATLPRGLRAVVDANPVSHLVTASRGLMAGGAHAGDVLWALGASAAVTAVFAPLAIRLYDRGR